MTFNYVDNSIDVASLLSGALSLALRCILWIEFLHMCLFYFVIVLHRYTKDFSVWDRHPQPRVSVMFSCIVLTNVWFSCMLLF
jgi:hypothetical protein